MVCKISCRPACWGAQVAIVDENFDASRDYTAAEGDKGRKSSVSEGGVGRRVGGRNEGIR